MALNEQQLAQRADLELALKQTKDNLANLPLIAAQQETKYKAFLAGQEGTKKQLDERIKQIEVALAALTKE